VHPAALAVFWLYLITVFTIILYYRFISEPGTGNRLEAFLDSQSFGVKLTMTCVGLSIKFYWSSLESYVRRIAPYAALASAQGASASRTMLVRSYGHPLAALFHADTWRHPLLGPVTLMAVLSELLVVALAAVPFSVAEAYLAFEVSVYLCVGILGLMVVVVSAVLPWRLATKHDIPEPPQCIGDAFARLGNSVVQKFSPLGTLGMKRRNRIIRDWQLVYLLQRGGSTANSPQNCWQIEVADQAAMP
jgi:hypothetical protein